MRTPIDLMTEEQYLVQEPQAEYKSEFRDGRIVAMAGASFAHNQITRNLIGELGQQLKHRPCEVIGSDMRVKVAAAHFYTYPDVVVFRGPPVFDAKDKNALVNPTLIIEVLSESTEAYDRGEKFAFFKKLDSLREYVLVSQDKVQVQAFFRQESGAWAESLYANKTDSVALLSIDCRLAVADIYHKVALPFV